MDKNYALLIIDMLNEYLDPEGKVYCEKCREIIPNIKKLEDWFRINDFPIIYVNTSLSFEEEPLSKKWGLHAQKGTWGSEVINELSPQKKDIIVNKRVYDGFYNTDLDLILRSLKITDVVVSGIHTHVCVLLTAVGAFNRGYNVIALEDCMTTQNPLNHESRLRFFNSHLGELLSSKEFIQKNSNKNE